MKGNNYEITRRKIENKRISISAKIRNPPWKKFRSKRREILVSTPDDVKRGSLLPEGYL